MQDTSDKIPRIPLARGNYAVRIYSHGLNSLSEDGLEDGDQNTGARERRYERDGTPDDCPAPDCPPPSRYR
jgi:hypothetical protein